MDRKCIRVLLTVGAQTGFDRLIKWMDELSTEEAEFDLDIFAQTGSGEYIPKNFKSAVFLTYDKYHDELKKADVVVSHCGMGTILQCLKYDKPVVVIPKLVDLNEHRNNHQVDSCVALKNMSQIYVATCKDDIIVSLLKIVAELKLNVHKDKENEVAEKCELSIKLNSVVNNYLSGY